EIIEHVPPGAHSAFHAASRFTLNVSRADMVRAGYSPSVRLFEAAASATAIISDAWPGIETFLKPNRDVIIATRPEDVLAALLSIPDSRRRRLAQAARRRVLANHTSEHRAAELETYLVEALQGRMQPAYPALAGSGAH